MAQRGIACGASGQYAEALEHWKRADLHAQEHVADAEISKWVRNGLGAAYCDVGQYEMAVACAEDVRQWCLSLRQPLASITLVRSLIALGRHAQAAGYLAELVALGRADPLEYFTPAERPAVEPLIRAMAK